jgi:acetylornithine deacetylase
VTSLETAVEMSAIELLRTLVGFQTISSDSNLGLIRWIAGYLESFGIASRLSHDETGRKANLLATIGEADGGIILSGHTDVVPVAGQDWSSDPFVLSERDRRLFGRGTCDMKGFIAVVLSLVPRLVERRSRTVHLAFSYDEEIGCLGVRRLLADLPGDGPKPATCIIGEPTNMRVIIGHKGAGMYAFRVTGRAAHSSRAPDGVNAIEYATRIIERFRDIALELQETEIRDASYDIDYSTIQVNRISGGTAGNIVADNCEFLVDIRSLPGTSQADILAQVDRFVAQELLPEMRRVAPEADIGWQRVGDVPGFSIAEDRDFVRDVKRALRSNEPAGYVAFGTEAGLFQRSGIETLVCGPGSIEQAHKPDEYVEIEQLDRCRAMLERLLLS